MLRFAKTVSFSLLAACHCLPAGCSRTYGDRIIARAERVKQGMGRKEVIGILGPPSVCFYDEEESFKKEYYYKILPRRLTGEADKRPICFIVKFESNTVVNTVVLW